MSKFKLRVNIPNKDKHAVQNLEGVRMSDHIWGMVTGRTGLGQVLGVEAWHASGAGLGMRKQKFPLF